LPRKQADSKPPRAYPALEAQREPITATIVSDKLSTTELAVNRRPIGPSPQSLNSRQAFRLRLAAIVFAIVPLSALGVASQLTPSSAGLGTHQQLGLPPCSMRLIFGIRCPGCGMTTSWTHFAQGNWLASLQTNVGGFLLAIFALWIAFLAICAAFSGQPPSEATQKLIAITASGIIAISILQWGYRLMT
jgi:hypothetical protein